MENSNRKKMKKEKSERIDKVDAQAWLHTLLIQVSATNELAFALKDRLTHNEKRVLNRFIKQGRQLERSLGADALEGVDPLVDYFVQNAQVCQEFVYQSFSGDYSKDKVYKLASGGIHVTSKEDEKE